MADFILVGEARYLINLDKVQSIYRRDPEADSEDRRYFIVFDFDSNDGQGLFSSFSKETRDTEYDRLIDKVILGDEQNEEDLAETIVEIPTDKPKGDMWSRP